MTFKFELWIDEEFVQAGESEDWKEAFALAIKDSKDLIGPDAKVDIVQTGGGQLPAPEGKED